MRVYTTNSNSANFLVSFIKTLEETKQNKKVSKSIFHNQNNCWYTSLANRPYAVKIALPREQISKTSHMLKIIKHNQEHSKE